MRSTFITVIFLLASFLLQAQDYFLQAYKPFDEAIPSPEDYLGYGIGEYHTRYDRIVSYFETLAETSNMAKLTSYGETHEHRPLIMLVISSPENLANLEEIKKKHLEVVDPNTTVENVSDLPLIVNLAYGVHGNEPSSSEAAMLTAYTLLASGSEEVKNYLKETVVFLDPTINPDGRDRHSNWANTYRGTPLIADPMDIEHNEGWPRGRTNHYWFDLNRDLLLAVHPESKGRLNWYHSWYPNVVTDFHEMGTSSTYFFEPKNKSASLNPITPAENRNVLNQLFAEQYAADLDQIGSLYFTDEIYDSTYPGYGSTYMDLQGSLALLFEQASSRGHLQETPTGEIDFAFTIRNQFVSSMATLKAAVNNKETLYDYQGRFFQEALNKAGQHKVKGYVFGDPYDKNRNKAFVDLLLRHQIEVYALDKDLSTGGKQFKKGAAYYVPSRQKQFYMVQSLFETYEKYRDSVYYDTSAWSMVNFYNMTHAEMAKSTSQGSRMTVENNKIELTEVEASNYAYLIPYDDFRASSFLYWLENKGASLRVSSRDFNMQVGDATKTFRRGTLVLSVQEQNEALQAKLADLINEGMKKFEVQAYAVPTGMTIKGNGLGSRSIAALKKPEVMMLVEGSVRSYEAGEIWHLFETKLEMPITKVPERLFARADLNRYNTIILVSGNYKMLTKRDKERLKLWVAQGNTLITTAKGSSWAIKQKLVEEELLNEKNDSMFDADRMDYADARGNNGKHNLGGAIFEVDLDLTHPLAYGYHKRSLPVYKNNRVWLVPAKNKFSTVARYTQDPHIDGYITPQNLDLMKRSASIIVSKIGKGRVVLFADNPSFRGAWYGTDKLLMNAVMFGSLIKVPE